MTWLHGVITADPTLELVRIRPDGSRTSARGPNALALLSSRGVSIFQLRDQGAPVTIRTVRP